MPFSGVDDSQLAILGSLIHVSSAQKTNLLLLCINCCSWNIITAICKIRNTFLSQLLKCYLKRSTPKLFLILLRILASTILSCLQYIPLINCICTAASILIWMTFYNQVFLGSLEWSALVAAWCSDNILVLINIVALHWAWLLLGWVTVCWQVTVSIRTQPPRSTQTFIPLG